MAAIATVMAATSIAALRTGLFARWLGWLGLILATGGAVGTIAWPSLAFPWFVGIFGWWPWALTIAVTCGLRLRLRRGVGRTESEPAPSIDRLGLVLRFFALVRRRTRTGLGRRVGTARPLRSCRRKASLSPKTK
jgi:MFS family permease